MIGRGIDVMLVQSNLRYRRPAKADEEIDVRLRAGSLGTTSMAMEAIVERDGEPLVEATLHYVFVDAAALTKTEIPPEIRAALS
jgi:acyl-CoA thioester hydrolase